MWIISVFHLSNLLEAELIGGELIGKASRPGRKLLCDVPHTVGELERYRVGQWPGTTFVLFELSGIKNRKNCECCPGHYLSTSVY